MQGCTLNCNWCSNPEGISNSPVLLYNSDFDLINSVTFDFLGPISFEYSTDDSRIYLSIKNFVKWKERMTPESHVIKTITFDDNLNEVSVTQQTEGEFKNE